jgi:hypothetical protein
MLRARGRRIQRVAGYMDVPGFLISALQFPRKSDTLHIDLMNQFLKTTAKTKNKT